MTPKTLETSLGRPSVRLLLAVLCGLVAGVLLYVREEQYMLKRSGGERKSILIAKNSIPEGERAEENNLDVQEVPRAYIHPSAIAASDLDKVSGRKLYREIKAAQPLLWSDFESPFSERTATSTPKGYRAISVQIGEGLAKSRLLSPGDYVDALANFNLSERGSVTTTLLQHIKVLEITETWALLQLSPEQAEQLAFALEHGTMRFVIRNREDAEQRNLPSATMQSLVKGASGTERPAVNTPQALGAIKDPKELLKQVFAPENTGGKRSK